MLYEVCDIDSLVWKSSSQNCPLFGNDPKHSVIKGLKIELNMIYF